ncbi:MAG: substrate-binding domain-containing protein [Anaerolineae bacterium]|nr:substrate-binding domain-containing protein [Anaerolineae bacterium]
MEIAGQRSRTTIGVLAGAQIYYRTILGNFVGPLLHGIASAAHDYGCNLLLSCGIEPLPQARPGWLVPGPDVDFLPVGPWNCDGLIVLNPLFNEPREKCIHAIVTQGTPLVYVAAGETGPSVVADNESGIRQAVAHLVAHGHRNIAFLAGYSGDTSGDGRIRLNAYLNAVREFDLASDPRLVVYSDHCISGGKLAVRQLLESGVRFTAIVASNDEAAIGALSTLRKARLRVPQDVAVIGFDDVLEALTQMPPLTTLHYSQSEMGYRALELLLEYLADPQKEARTIKIPVRLVTRHSCGCSPGAQLETQGGDLPGILSCKERPSAMAHLVQAMTESAMSEAQRLCVEEVHVLCSRLVEAFISSAKFGEPATFYHTLDEILAQTETMMEDAYIWHAAAAVLESHLELLLGTGRLSQTRALTETMLHRMWAMVTGSVRRQFRQQIVRKQWVGDCTGRLSARLLDAMNESQIYEIMAENLSYMGIDRVDVAFYEPEGDDPVAMSAIRSVTPHGDSASRTATREFPAPGMYSEPFQLALLPLRLEDRTGFVAFDTAKLEIYGSIVWQLVTFFKAVRLYQMATEDRRLAEEANRFKSRFLSMVSHELRTPLSLIIGLSEMVLRDETDDEVVRCRDLETILASARDLDALLRDVLTLSRADVRQLQLTCEEFDLAEVLRSVAAVGRQLANDKGLIWRAAIPERLPRVWGDRTRLRQVVMNLVGNAVKFTRRGSVELRAIYDAEAVTVSVKDTGPGVPPDERDTIFAEFHQSTRTSDRGYGGLGLGLAICKLLVEMHQGQIGVESSGVEGDGAIFHFSIPCSRVTEAAWAKTTPALLAAPHPAAVPGVDRQSAAGKTLLIVDDDPYILQMHARMVRLWSPEIQVLEARGGQEALDLMRETTPDLVLLDLMMPEVDGFKVLTAMREAPSTRDVPVVVVTAQVLSQEAMARLNQGVASVLQKEMFSAPEMLSHVVGALERHKTAPAPVQALARRAMGYLHEHYKEAKLSLESVAEHFDVSKEHLARCFREETGVTLITYLNRYRIERAKALLRENQMRIVDVALGVGFSSNAYFSRVFKHEVGQSPQEYRHIA